MAQEPPKKPIELARELGFIAAVACGVGSIIGSGIFKKPALMASQLPSAELLILVWVVAGVLTLFGTLSIAEVSSMFQEAGGLYGYFNKSYGDFVGYLYGWATFAVIQTGSIASIAYVFSDSLGYFVKFFRLPAAWETVTLQVPFIGNITPFKSFGLKLATIGLIVFLTVVNYLGVRFGSAVQVVFSVLKVLAIAAIVILVLALGSGHLGNFTQSALGSDLAHGSVFLMFIVAMAGAFWAYDAWINVTYMAGEIKNPQRNLPRSLATAVLIVIVVYVLVNLAYIYIIPVEEMGHRYVAAEAAGQSYLVATDVVGSFLGHWGGALIAVAIMISTFGATNGIMMMAARVYYAMAQERLFFRSMSRVHPRFRTPANALLWQGVWSSVLVLSGTFDQLTDQVIFVSWISYLLGALCVFVLRRKMPDHPRPYKVWGFPLTPILFMLFASVYIFFTLYSDISGFLSHRFPLINSVMGLFWVAIGIPGFLYWAYKRKRQAPAPSKPA
jgi:APA family basic amino acid/polyamine antiporter